MIRLTALFIYSLGMRKFCGPALLRIVLVMTAPPASARDMTNKHEYEAAKRDRIFPTARDDGDGDAGRGGLV